MRRANDHCQAHIDIYRRTILRIANADADERTLIDPSSVGKLLASIVDDHLHDWQDDDPCIQASLIETDSDFISPLRKKSLSPNSRSALGPKP